MFTPQRIRKSFFIPTRHLFAIRIFTMLVASLLAGQAAAAQTSQVAYVANSSSNVAGYAVDPTVGTLSQLAGSPFPNSGGGSMNFALHPSNKFLYVADGLNAPNGISAYSISPTGSLQMIGTPVNPTPPPPVGGD